MVSVSAGRVSYLWVMGAAFSSEACCHPNRPNSSYWQRAYFPVAARGGLVIPRGTLLAASPPVPIEDTLGTYVLCLTSGGGRNPVYSYPATEPEPLFAIETWYEADCRECLHKTNLGSVFSVSEQQDLVLKNGDFAKPEGLGNGSRLLASGCKCAFLVVKNVVEVSSGGPVDLFGVAADTYGVTDGEHTVFLRGSNSHAND